MAIYEEFTEIYDELVGHQGFSDWRLYFEALAGRLNISFRSVLDAGCGTGSMAGYVAERVSRVYGFDASARMVAAARRKNRGNRAVFWAAGFLDFALAQSVDLITANYNALNYLTGEGELARALARFREHLAPGGWLVFDLNSTYHLEHNWGTDTVVLRSPRAFAVWETKWLPAENINEMTMNNFVRRPDDLWELHEEMHRERGYEADEVLDMLAEAGFDEGQCFEMDGLGPVSRQTGRLVFAARK